MVKRVGFEPRDQKTLQCYGWRRNHKIRQTVSDNEQRRPDELGHRQYGQSGAANNQ